MPGVTVHGTKCRRLGALAVACLALSAAAYDGEARRARVEGDAVSHWHVGPFFEYRRGARSVYTAVRPFYSRVRDEGTSTSVDDCLWPLAAFHAHGGSSWWRALIAFGDERDDDGSEMFNVFPFWFSGRTRQGEDYWGLFPFYGHHPHVVLVDDWDFVLWPFWHTYTVKGVRSHAVLWPFVTWRDAPREGVGVWPIWGRARQRESEHAYLLWPIFTHGEYETDRDTSGAGFSWMFWPLLGHVSRERETQWMALPPFFSCARTDDATRWRLPWPFFESLKSTTRDRLSIWPLWEHVHGYPYSRRGNGADAETKPEEKTWRVGWQLVESTELTSANTRLERFLFFPFYTRERRVEGNDTRSFDRVWPFWSREDVNGCMRSRVLELNPIRHSEGMERNWSPFWTFYECEDRPNGRRKHALFWHLITWHTEPEA